MCEERVLVGASVKPRHTSLADQASQFLQLFPGDPLRHLVLHEVLGPGRKRQETRPGPLTTFVALRHLRAQAMSGYGGAGVAPCRPAVLGRFGEAWVGNWFAVDLDSFSPQLVVESGLTRELVRRGLVPYLSRGTTGRGAHIYVFVESSVTQEFLYQAGRAVGLLAEAHGLKAERPFEVFPSRPYGKSLALHLPWRGAAFDGFGANPLLEPEGLMPLGLWKLELVERTPTASLEGLVREFPARLEQREQRPVPQRVQQVADPLERWRSELKRVAPHWVQGYRQKLALGLTAVGLGWGIPPEVVRADIERLALRCGDEEARSRLRAVDDTIKDARAGKRVAARRFYEAAGLEPPCGEVDPRAVAILDALEASLDGLPSNRGGLVDGRVFAQLLLLARRHGVLVEDGVEVSVSQRELAQRSGVSSREALENSLRRLGHLRLVRVARRGGRTEPGSFVLLENAAANQSFYPAVKGSRELKEFRDELRFFRVGGSGLTPLAGLLFGAALAAGKALDLQEMASLVWRKSTSLSRPLRALREAGLLLTEGRGRYRVARDWREALRRASVLDGAADALTRQVLLARDDRDANEAQLALKATGEVRPRRKRSFTGVKPALNERRFLLAASGRRVVRASASIVFGAALVASATALSAPKAAEDLHG
jgi:DNA-binding transcriptional ArsR family regulator